MIDAPADTAATGEVVDVVDPTYAAVAAFVDELVRRGVRDFCLCPGSRSTPLALTVGRHAGARLWMHLDERSAAFFGLGLARAQGTPVALVCTSGTAAANFLPAVVEAHYSGVPLVVLTADRPPELRDRGAPQTIDQTHLYGRHAKWFLDVGLPEGTPEGLRHLRAVAARAAAVALAYPVGPVHLNCPYREPLIPGPGQSFAPPGRAGDAPHVAIAPALPMPPAETVQALTTALRGLGRGLIVCGPQPDAALAPVVAALARRLGYPVLADPLSGVRRGSHDRSAVLDAYDAFLRDEAFAQGYAPQVVLRFGAMPTSKPLLLYLQRHRGHRHIVVEDGRWSDPAALATDVLTAHPVGFCAALLAALGPPSGSPDLAWLEQWRWANAVTTRAMADCMAGMAEPFEGRVFDELAGLLPAGSTLYAGNSMPVRDLDTFFGGGDRAVRCLANRGANGIDGVVSSALGAAAAASGPTVLAIGDISFYHDSNGLLAAKRHHLDLTVVLLNNDGGGIFSFLPQAAYSDQFETLFGTPHGLDFRPIAEAYGATYSRPDDWPAFRAAVSRGLAAGGLHVVEVRTDRERNVALHRAVWRAVSQALAEQGVTP